MPATSCSAPATGPVVGRDQRRPDPQRQEQAAVVRRPDHGGQHRRRGVRHHLRHRRVAEAEGRPLGRVRRRARPRLPGRRQDVDQRHERDPRLPRLGNGSVHRSRRRPTRARLTLRSRPPGSTNSGRTCGKTADFGKTWQSPGGQAARRTVHLHVVRTDPAKKGMLYVGSERGVRLLDRRRGDWQPPAANTCRPRPSTTCRSRATTWSSATRGRSLWIFDDLTPVRRD